MESLLEPVELNQETTQALDEIRSGADNALYGADSADAEEKMNSSVLPLIEGAGLPSLQVMHYRWYLRELARHWRSRKGRDLAFHLELCVRKWVHLGLEPRTLQFLVCEAHQRLKASQPLTADRQPLTAPSLNPDPRPLTLESVDVLSGSASASTPNPDPQPLTPDLETAKTEPGGDMTEIGSEISDRVPSPETQSAKSAKSVDVRSGSAPAPSPTPGPQSLTPGLETAERRRGKGKWQMTGAE